MDLYRPVEDRGDIESKVMGERPADGRAGLDIQDDPKRLAADAPSGDGSDLTGDDHASGRNYR